MQKEKTIVSFFKMLGYAVLGNLMGVIISFSLAAFFGGTAANILTAVLGFVLYHLMIFSATYRSGVHEKKLLKIGILSDRESLNRKWLIIAAIVGIIMIVPSVILLICEARGMDFVLAFRFISGANFSTVLCLPPGKYSFAPYIYMIVYILTPVSAILGYKTAFSDKITMDKIIYTQKK